ncbi:hypothetical protein NFI96_026576 [Prochilodus magdalenae]|nr:hypothetical protein NFI96_026576 [Prochilodus magdalenae]
MSLSLEELCAMVNVSYEEVKNTRVNRATEEDGEGVQNRTGPGEGGQREYRRKHGVFHTPAEPNRPAMEAEGGKNSPRGAQSRSGGPASGTGWPFPGSTCGLAGLGIPGETLSSFYGLTLVSDSDSEAEEAHQPKRKRGPSNWKRNVQKRRRMEGKSYSGKRKDVGEVTRAARAMGPGCVSEACKKSAKRFCHTFSEEERQGIFRHFWQNMNWEERRLYVAGLVDHTPVARKRSASQDSRRLSTLSYHLGVDGEKRRVCKKFFLSTLGLGEWSVAHWVQTSETERNHSQAMVGDEALASLQAFLRDLPKVPSHYCQSSSSKLFLEPMFRSISELHELYQRHCEEELQTTPLSREILMNEFNHLNLALYHPKNNQCSTCCSDTEHPAEEDVLKDHGLIKEEACEEGEEESEEATDEGKAMSRMDLQTLLLCQKLKASSFYYRTKLALRNLTVFSMAEHSGARRLWPGGEGGSVTDCFQQPQHDEEEE